MHIYWKRHMLLIEKMEEYFPDKQIIATTHSPILIQNMKKKYLYDLEDLLVDEDVVKKGFSLRSLFEKLKRYIFRGRR
jgi:predicted ATP-binding protein involved in virulence